MMNDPSTANSRIYVGNIPTSEMTKKDLEDRFKKHGAILGIALNRGFGFVQYEEETSAVEAIKQENGAVFRGKKMEVNQARVVGGGRRSAADGPGGPRRGDSMDKGDSYRERSPLDDRGRDRDRYEGFAGKSERDRSFYGRDGGFKKEVPFSASDNFRGSISGRDDRGFGFTVNPIGDAGTFAGSRSLPSDRIVTGKNVPASSGYARMQAKIDTAFSLQLNASSYRGGIGDPRGKDYPPAPANVGPMDRTNDCEIIVVSKNQREYAEYIEHRLKQLGLTVDLLFPNEEVPIGRVLANISSRGSLYAILVMPQNEEHRSLTLNILHGLPQEHRNMPLEDAVPLIMRNFEAYIRGEKLPAPISTPIPVVSSSVPLSERHPEAIQVLLNLLSDNRQLTVLQYDRVIRYLQDKRELQLQHELGDAKDLPSAKPTAEPTNKQQVDLQHRILNILNSTSGSVASSGATIIPTAVPAPVAPVPAPITGSWGLNSQSGPTGAGPTPLLNDPTVQKALDSLLQGNLLHKISSSASLATTTASSLGAPPSQPLFGAFAGGAGRRF